ncbi:unnamed protein product [Adineta ricciae]|uniref:Membrane-associated protein n=2 Tax=Adineta ricciae TaxID=249248 RepID=A0A815AJG0_ADIRI|nr:unnamed protein product [Adineta ricciae]
MYRVTSTYTLFIVVLLSIATTSWASSCDYTQRTCYGNFGTWCCAADATCGASDGVCYESSDLPPAVIAIIIIASIFCFVVCLSCCIQSRQREQRLRATAVNTQTRLYPASYQNNAIRGPVRVVQVRHASHVRAAPPVATFPSLYEALPPSYEIAVATSPSVHQLPASPPMTATVEQSDVSNV